MTEAITLTRTAFDLGYDAVVVLPPYYFRTVTENGLFAYFSELIRRALPRDGSLLIYHIPSLTGVALSLFWLKRLSRPFRASLLASRIPHQADFARQLGDSFGEELAVSLVEGLV